MTDAQVRRAQALRRKGHTLAAISIAVNANYVTVWRRLNMPYKHPEHA
jgi:hypothetical protein